MDLYSFRIGLKLFFMWFVKKVMFKMEKFVLCIILIYFRRDDYNFNLIVLINIKFISDYCRNYK